DLLGPDHHGHVPRMRAAMAALGHPLDAFQALIIQLVTLLRDGQPVRMSKRRGEFVLMEELLEEVGRDAARFTFLTRRHDSPLELHRIAYWLTELAGAFHPYYKNHRVLQDDRRLMFARLALCSAVGQVIANGLALLGVSAPETM